MKHTIVQPCPSCADKLRGCHPDMAVLHAFVVALHPDAHISWGFRDEENQKMAYSCGRSKLQWPNSPHNKTDETGAPQSVAVDYFRLDDTGGAHWDKDFFTGIWSEVASHGFNIRWGGMFSHLGDFDHFERVIRFI